MCSVAEAIRTGKRGVVFQKAGQIGGTDAMINAMLWLKEYFPGPQLFMTSTDKVASEFGRERFALIIRDMEPLRKKYISKKRGDIFIKRFVDGKIQLCGGQSVFNLQSTPYRVVVIDELDSLVQNLGGQGDPVKLAEVRTDSFVGQTLIIAYAHPSTPDRGSARLYSELSDQRRGFVRHECGHDFWLNWDHVTATPIDNSMSQEQAMLDSSCYAYYCPGCGAEISDSERVGMVRAVVYRSILTPDEAKKKTWIGMHASQLYSPGRTIKAIASRWIECFNDENAKRVFYNKILGEPFETRMRESSIGDWRQLIVIPRREADPEAYRKGQVPPGVRFLTAGQDSRSEQFHYAVWGWGLARLSTGATVLRRWLIDWDEITRQEKSLTINPDELRIFDQLVYDRYYPTTYSNLFFDVRECAHDTGWNPNAVYEYCRHWEWRAIPTKGGAESSLSQAPAWRESHRPKYKINGEEYELDQPLIVFNTYQLKLEWYGSLGRRIKIVDSGDIRDVSLVSLPMDVDDGFLEQASSEFLTNGKKKGEKLWEHRRPNHFADCTVYAYGLAMKINPFQGDLPFDEAVALDNAKEKAESESRAMRAMREKNQEQTPLQRYGIGGDWVKG